MNKHLTTVSLIALLAILSTLVTSGIIRHDVPAEAYFELAAQPQFACVGAVLSEDNDGSGVLISPRHVLTAAHIFKKTETRPDTMEFQGQTVVVYRPVKSWIDDIGHYPFKWGEQSRRGIRLSLHPSYTDSTAEEQVDLAIIELESPVTDITPAKLNVAANELHAKVVGVGYGAYIIANQPENADHTGLKVAGMNTIDQLGGVTADTPQGPMKTRLIADLDHPENDSCCNKMGEAAPLPLEYGTTGGDSGGGLFMQNGKEWQLIGITKEAGFDMDDFLQYGYYGAVSEWIRVAAYRQWVETQIQ